MTNEVKRNENKPAKLAYEPPQLKVLGSLYEITKGPTGGFIDGLFGAPGGFPTPS